jgi:hypothetical protein
VLFVRGWALDGNRRPGTRIVLALGNAPPTESLPIQRPDIAEAYGFDARQGAGFAAAVSTGTLSAGSHALLVLVASHNRWYRVPSDRRVWIGATDEPRAAVPLRVDNWTIGFDGIFVGEDRIAGGVEGGVGLTAGIPAYLRGWAVDLDAQLPLGGVLADDGGGARPGVVGFERPEIPPHLGLEGIERCGFAIPLLAPAGAERVVRIWVLSADRRSRAEVTLQVARAPYVATRALRRLDGAPPISLDGLFVGVDPQRGTVVEPGVRLKTQDLLWVRGWAIDPGKPTPSTGVTLVVDGKREITAQVGLERRDVAAAYGDDAVASSGFAVAVPLATLGRGEHRVAVRALAAKGAGYWETEPLSIHVGD